MKTLRTLLTVFISMIVLMANSQPQQGDISGTILYHNNQETPLPDVELKLYNAEGELQDTTYSDEEGAYFFEGVDYATYYITPSYEAEGGEATMVDAVKIMLHLMGVQELEGIEALAADVDGDSLITWNDHGLVVNHFLTGEPFPAGEWVFEDIIHNVGAKEGGGDENYGSSVGDVSGAWEPGQRSLPLVEATYTAHRLMQNSTEALTIKADNDMAINGAGLVINYPAEYIHVNDVTTTLPGAKVRTENGTIKIAWTSEGNQPKQINRGDKFITLEASLIRETSGQMLRFTLSDISHMADAEGERIKNAVINMPEIGNTNKPAAITQFAPNPVSTSGKVSFYLSQSDVVTIDLVDLSGRIVKTITSRHFAEGAHQMDFRRGDMESGIYMLQLKTSVDKRTQSQKVIIR